MERVKDLSKYGWSDPPHKLHYMIYRTDEYTVCFTLKVFALDNIEVESLEVTPVIKTIDWTQRARDHKRRGLRLTEEDRINEELYPYLMLESE